MSEKQPLINNQPPPPSRRSRWANTPLIALGLIVTGTLWSLSQSTASSSAIREEAVSKPWSWEDITPSKDLQWEDCYNDFKCARLDVPLDWQDPSESERVVLGVIKLPAKSDEDPVPPLLVNPGGPGGSGVYIVREMGKQIQKVAGDNHDVISWDPRGVGTSTPRVECWGSYQTREMWSLQDTHVVDERPGLIYDALARATALSATCKTANNDTRILHYVSTASSARDMLEIVEKTGHDKLRYWGFSYGTILGGVFATLFPDRVERLVSDGNVDYTSWFEGDRSLFSKDADLILKAFDETCHKAGPDKCDLWAESPEEVQARRDTILAKLKRSPVVVPAWVNETGPDIPIIITYSRIETMTRAMIYKPIFKVEKLASIYAALDRGDGVPYWDHVREDESDSSMMCTTNEPPATVPDEVTVGYDAVPAIMCADSVPVEADPDEFDEYVKKLRGVSKYVGPSNIMFRLACAGWGVKPKWQAYPKSDEVITTDQPILFVNNVFDNITPLESAHNNSAVFPGSGLLTQRSYGHCSFAAPSKCTAKHIRAYFKTGELPEPGTECPQDYEFFELPDDERIAALEQDELSLASWELSRMADLTISSRHGL